jgi:predicted kinase
MGARGTLHLLIGPVGAGKTTYARRRCATSPALFLDLDEWMVRLFGDDPRPPEGVIAWYLARRERCRVLIWELTKEALACGVDVVLEIGLVGAAERASFYDQARAASIELKVHLVDAPRDVRRDRVAARNAAGAPFTQIVPPAFFEAASDAWEPPSAAERAAWNIIDA